jgi:malonyl CoA-acyl carrier protein transacylase
MTGAVYVLLPPTASHLAQLVLDAGCTPVIDATGEVVPAVPAGAWVRTRPGRPAPGAGPVVLAELGAPIEGRPTWLEASAPREVPAGFAGLVLKGREAGGFGAEEDGLLALAQCPEPGRVLLDAGVGPATAAAAAALGAAGVLLVEQHLGCPELGLPPGLARRLALADDEVSQVVAGARVANPVTAPVLRRLAQGEDPWALADGVWSTGDLRAQLWMVGQGLALAAGLAERHGGLAGVLAAYVDAWSQWPARARAGAAVAAGGASARTAAQLAQPDAVASAGGAVGSGVLWQEARWMGRAIAGEPLVAALATGADVVADPGAVAAARQALPAVPDVVAAPVAALSAPVAASAAATCPAELGPIEAPAVAVIGLGCRFPDANSVDEYWSNILAARSSITEVPADRWDPALFWDADAEVPDKTYAKIGAFLKDFRFDAKRFRIPPKVVGQVDPVQQITLACVADALEDAGLQVDAKGAGRPFDRARCAVILGNSLGGEVTDVYAVRVAWPGVRARVEPALAALPAAERAAVLAQMEAAYKAGLPEVTEDSMPGELANVIAGRIANAFDLGGANFTVDAACASSMAAIQSAVKTLQDGEADLVVTGGADRSMNVATYVKFSKIGALSPDHSAPFDASANGFVMGEGCGILVLKRLEDAVRDGDRVYALIRGVGASSDGKGKGITAPNVQGQIRALSRAYASAGIDPWEVDLVECHGTSTVVGDKVEVEALTEVIGAGHRGDRGPIRIGSVKSQIGHLKSAAGAAAAIKVTLALHHATFPPSAGYRTARPDVPLQVIPLQVQTQPEPWPAPPSGLRRAGVSAFGFGGTNFHLVFEGWSGQAAAAHRANAPATDAPRPAVAAPVVPSVAPVAAAAASHPVTAAPIAGLRPPGGPRRPSRPALPDGLWATSANDLPALLANLKALARGESAPWNPSAPLRIAAAALSDEERLGQIERALATLEKNGNPDMLRSRAIYFEDGPVDGDLALLFTGQGSQYVGMGLDLAEAFPIVAETYAEADRVLAPKIGRPITDLIRLLPGESEDEKEELLKQTEYSQPATLTMDVAILRLLAAFGVHPNLVAGHSLGEYGAAVAAGVMTFDQALHAVSARGREMANIQLDDPGKMAGIAASAEVVEAVLAEVDGYVVAANKNCPTQTVIAGASDAVDDAVERFKARGMTVHLLAVSHAFHSAIVAPASEPLRGVLDRLGLAAPLRSITTNVTGEYYPSGPQAAPQIVDLLARQISSPVEWTAQMERMYADGARVFVECGPKRALAGFTVAILKRRNHRALYTNHPKRGGVASFLDTLAGLLAAGFPVRAQAAARVADIDLFADPAPRFATSDAILGAADEPTQTEPLPDLTAGILQIVASATGYAPADLHLDDELEADLGIDTVKQAEVFATVRQAYGIARDDSFDFTKHRTLRAVIGWAAERTGATRIAMESAQGTSVAVVPVPAAAPVALGVSDEAIGQFVAAAVQAGLQGGDAAAFTRALLPAVQSLLSAAFTAARAVQPAPIAVAPSPAPAPSAPPASASVAAVQAPPALIGAPFGPDLARRVVCTGASVGLPGGRQVFDDDNVASILRGENRITALGDRAAAFLDIGLVRLVKDAQTGQGSFLPVTDAGQVIRLAGVKADFDLRGWGVPDALVDALDITTQLAFAAGYEALRDAGIPLVRQYKTAANGKKIPQGWALPPALRDGTGVVFGSAFPGYDRLVEKLAVRGADADGHFDRRFLFQVLSMGHSQFAQAIGARGPNAAVNAACASTTQALALAEDWIRLGRAERVIVVGADDVTGAQLLPWIGGGFMAAGAASTGDRVEEVALPFDRRRHGLVLGMGAAGLVLESAEGAARRGAIPIAELLGTATLNSAFHGTRLDADHIADAMTQLVGVVCDREGLSPAALADQAFFVSHETYTPARGGSAGAEIAALRKAFGPAASRLPITNTKGFTGHPMGAGIEDTIAVKALQYGILPPIANFREPDETLGDLRLSRGERGSWRYALRLAAGFGSQLVISAWKGVATGDARVSDAAARDAWLRAMTGFAQPVLRVEERTLRVVDGGEGVPSAPSAPSAPAAAPPAPSVAPVAGAASILGELIALVAEKTGYDPSEVEPDYELEADLGIDTVKQAEILADLTSRYGIRRDESFRIADYPTLRALAGYVVAQLGGGAAAPPAAPAAAPVPQPVPAPVPGTVAAPVVPVAPVVPLALAASPAPSGGDTLAELLAVVAEKTGYETSEIEPGFELEADLGVDTVKQAEILSTLRSRYGLAPDDNFRLADWPTLADLARYLDERRGGSAVAAAPVVSAVPVVAAAPVVSAAPVAAAAPVGPSTPVVAAPVAPRVAAAAPGDTLAALLAVVAEKTGYEVAELEPGFELEADLGVDTVKQAEILSTLRERFALPPDDAFRLADWPTLADLARYLDGRRTATAGGASPPAAAPQVAAAEPVVAAPVPVAAPVSAPTAAGALPELLALVAEKTGYEVAELEPGFELEADLGIDTVKQAEILSELRARYGLPPDEAFRLADHPTLAALAAYLDGRRAVGGPAVTRAPTSSAPEAAPRREPVAPLPDWIRVRRPRLVPAPAVGGRSLAGARVQVIGAGPVADAVRAALARAGAGTDGAPTVVVDVAGDALVAFRAARALVDARPTRWLTVTRLGGLKPVVGPEDALADGARAGFTKSLGREWEIDARVLDLWPTASPAEVAEAVVAELGVAEPAPEVFRDAAGGRAVVGYGVEPAPAQARLQGWPVVLVTGGGRGITARVALELARRGPARLAIAGRGAPLDRVLDEKAEKDAIKARLTSEGERATPARIEAVLEPLRRADEIRRTLEVLRGAGAEVHYLQCDLASAAAAHQLVVDVEAHFGPIDLVIHGAGVEESRFVADKDERAWHRVYDGKAVGGEAIALAIPATARFVSMGSVAGRFGNPGQVDYAAANDGLARLCLARGRALHVDWTAWDDVGMAVRGGMRHLLTERGVQLLPAEAGARLLVDLLIAGVDGELVVSGALGGLAPKPTHPLVDEVESDGPVVRLRRLLSTATDPWIADHAIDGAAVLPGVIGIELMAAAARLALPGLPYAGVRDVHFDAPCKVHRDQPTEVVVEARPVGDGAVACALWSTRTLKTGRVQRTEHFRATVLLGDAPAIDALPSAFLPDEGVTSAEVYQRFFHGPIFQVLTAVFGVSADGLLAEGRVASDRIAPGLLTEPLALEAAFQAAGLHGMLVTHAMGLPASIGALRVLAAVPADQPVSIAVQRVGEVYQVDIDGLAGPILRLRDFRMVTRGDLPPGQRFPVPAGGRPTCFPAPPQRAEARATASEDPSAWLTPDELVTLQARGTARRVRDRIAGRIAAKRAISALTGRDPLTLRVVRRADGAPVVEAADGAPCAVSIAHRDGVGVAVAVRCGHIGVDLEAVAPRPASFAESWLTPGERALARDDASVTLVWAAKEAVLKALGTGLALPATSVEVTAIGPGTLSFALHGPAHDRWQALGGGPWVATWHHTADGVWAEAHLAA